MYVITITITLYINYLWRLLTYIYIYEYFCTTFSDSLIIDWNILASDIISSVFQYVANFHQV